MKDLKVLYLCDKQKEDCEKTNCSEEFCHHTADVSHAINFEKIVDTASGEVVVYAEKESGWIPITYRPMTTEERIAFAEHYGVEYCDTLEEKAFDCPMPEDGQEILISKSWGVVADVADNDIDGEGFICYGLEGNGDWDGVDAWMPKPEPYKKEVQHEDS